MTADKVIKNDKFVAVDRVPAVDSVIGTDLMTTVQYDHRPYFSKR
jgi:hypothetical protein